MFAGKQLSLEEARRKNLLVRHTNQHLTAEPDDFRPAMLLALLVGLAAAVSSLAGSPGLPTPMMSMSGSEPMQMAGRSPGITSTIASQEKLAHVAGKSVTVEIVEFPPLAFAPEPARFMAIHIADDGAQLTTYH